VKIPLQIQAEYPFNSHWQNFDSYKLHYVDEGEGRAVIMLHGNPTWSFYYRNVVKALSKGFRCLAIDHIGCGLSDKPQQYTYSLKYHIENVLDWVDKLGLDDFDLIVHDWGGAIGMGVARRIPNKIGKMVILNTAAFNMDRIPKRIAACRIPIIGNLIVRGFNGFAVPALTMAVEKPMSEDVRDGFIFPYNNWANRVGILRFVQDIPTNPTQDSFGELAEIEKFLPQLLSKDILIGWGLKDFCFNQAFLEKWKEFFPDAKVLSYPKAGHYVLEDEKDTLIPEMVRFLEES
tara:strand:- start:1533 stop:2402 length:870 start_codon:yes stop_codon:yes gene_type:complete